MLREMGVEGDRAWLRGWKGGREQVAMATGRFEGVEERGKTAQMMEKECYRCITHF